MIAGRSEGRARFHHSMSAAPGRALLRLGVAQFLLLVRGRFGFDVVEGSFESGLSWQVERDGSLVERVLVVLPKRAVGIAIRLDHCVQRRDALAARDDVA